MSEQRSNVKEHRVLVQRVVVSVIAIPIIVAVIWFGEPWLTILAAGWGMGAAYEFFGLVKRSKGLSPMTYFGLLWVLLFIISPHFDRIPYLSDISPVSLLLTGAVIIPLILLLWRKGKENAFANWAWTVGGILYIGWLLSNMVALRSIEYGQGWVFVAVLCTFASDSSAYLAGRSLGKHKMAPYISPKKSWEGAVAGVAGAIIACSILVFLFKLPITYWQIIILGFFISILGQLGDLVKSLFKRNMEVKDSGNILPGHGGFLDRMDSLAFAGVAVYYFVSFITPVAG
jgi:phosphatidate cytidylyltransferase